ncbi:MAG: MraZ N-terminal domain-containing protein, partial [Planctomycetota bacterium]
MLFTGSTELNIDAKGRLSIPSRYRAQLTAKPKEGDDNTPDTPSAWIALPWPDGSIRLYTEHTFEELGLVCWECQGVCPCVCE